MHWPISSNYSFSHKAYEVKSIWTDPMIHLDVIKEVKFSPNDTLNLHEIKTELEGISVWARLLRHITGQVAEHIAFHQKSSIRVPKGAFLQNTTRQIYDAHLLDFSCSCCRCSGAVNEPAKNSSPIRTIKKKWNVQLNACTENTGKMLVFLFRSIKICLLCSSCLTQSWWSRETALKRTQKDQKLD